MRRTLPLFVALSALAVAPGAEARYVELGADSAPEAKASCPENCQGIGRVSGYMGRAGGRSDPYVIRRDGVVTAFTVTLGKPNQEQTDYFTNLYGSPPQMRLSILRPGTTRRTRLTHRLLRQSDLFRVDRYFGSSPTFALDEPLEVERGNVVALTVPTWAPAFGVNLPRTNWWRSSRRRGECDNISQRAAQQFVGGLRIFGCTYFRARLLYTVTYVPEPRPTDGSDRRTRR
jgi:hypothetical protein